MEPTPTDINHIKSISNNVIVESIRVANRGESLEWRESGRFDKQVWSVPRPVEG